MVCGKVGQGLQLIMALMGIHSYGRLAKTCSGMDVGCVSERGLYPTFYQRVEMRMGISAHIRQAHLINDALGALTSMIAQ